MRKNASWFVFLHVAIISMLPAAFCQAAESQGAILEGTSLRLADFRGQVVALGVGKIDCEKSREGLGHLQKLRLSGREGLTPLFVFSGDKKEAVREFCKKRSLSYPLFSDPGKVIAARYRAGAFPTFLLVGKWGEVRYRGPWPAERTETMLAALLTEKESGEKAFFQTKALRVGQQALPFALRDLGNKPFNLNLSLKKSKLTLVLFGNNVCPFSKKAYTELNALWKKQRKSGLGLAVVHIGKADAAARELYKSLRLECPVAVDVSEKVADAYGIEAVPTAYLIQPDGKIFYRALYSPEVEKTIANYWKTGGTKPPPPPKKSGAAPGG